MILSIFNIWNYILYLNKNSMWLQMCQNNVLNLFCLMKYKFRLLLLFYHIKFMFKVKPPFLYFLRLCKKVQNINKTSERLKRYQCSLISSSIVRLYDLITFVVISQEIMLGRTCNFYHSFLGPTALS